MELQVVVEMHMKLLLLEEAVFPFLEAEEMTGMVVAEMDVRSEWKVAGETVMVVVETVKAVAVVESDA